MQITVMFGDKLINMEVLDDMEIINFKALCRVEAELPETAIDNMHLLCKGKILEDPVKTLKDYDVKNGDIIMMQNVSVDLGRSSSSRSKNSGLASIDFGAISVPGAQPSSSRSASGYPDDPRAIYDMLRGSPHELAIIRERNPPLSQALDSGEFDKFKQVLNQQRKERADKEAERLRLLTADPFDAEAQKKIAEEIRLNNIDSNMETAMEYAPESFGQVVMLYIDCLVNGHHVKAFVDSGAQMTIMSQSCAERCGIMRLVDTRWAGIAKGVGVQKIMGRVHIGQIQIGNDYLQSSFSILEEQPMDMLLGLDMLKRHQCVVDLKNNELVIGTTGTRTTFLPESDLPEHARLNRPPSTDDDQLLAEALNRSAKDASTSRSTASPGPTQVLDPAFEGKVRAIMDSGFSRDQAIKELRRSNGDMDQALATLLASSFSNVKR